jgi:excisionase family DNA binding protein
VPELSNSDLPICSNRLPTESVTNIRREPFEAGFERHSTGGEVVNHGDEITPLTAPILEEAKLERLTLTTGEICAMTGLGRDKILELLRAGVIPSVRVGRRYLVTRAHVDAFLQQKPLP